MRPRIAATGTEKAAMASASASVFTSSPSRRPTAAVAPMAPVVDVGAAPASVCAGWEHFARRQATS